MRTIRGWNLRTSFSAWVVRKLLSERDENVPTLSFITLTVPVCRKETTLWKRWERRVLMAHGIDKFMTSEGNYSLKEMRTFEWHLVWERYLHNVGRKLLSERDENIDLGKMLTWKPPKSRKETTLWKRWELLPRWHKRTLQLTCRKETTLWKRWES